MNTSAHPPNPAAQRLEQSRRNLRQAMLANTKAFDKPSAAQSEPSSWAQGLKLLGSKPSGYLLAQTAQQIWANNPWRILAHNAAQAADIMLAPVAQRSPAKLVAGAFVVGALLLLVRPWRLLSRQSLIKNLLMR